MNILVTGSAGMIGSYVVKGLIEKGHTVIGVDRIARDITLQGLTQIILDLSSKEGILQLFDDKKIDRVIHLAALAHTKGVADTSWAAFKKVNVDCAENLFEVCAKHDVPVLFISTVDAIGMVKGVITPETELNPISNYGKSKALAESRLKEICSRYNIYRFSPVYTEDVKRDI
jgi:nucleoside-diphosphate-sugar epimerase